MRLREVPFARAQYMLIFHRPGYSMYSYDAINVGGHRMQFRNWARDPRESMRGSRRVSGRYQDLDVARLLPDIIRIDSLCFVPPYFFFFINLVFFVPRGVGLHEHRLFLHRGSVGWFW